ncbi:MAG: flagellar biosynthesis anti-sigma factor FlgM [Planctomycetaceae bacterium]
MQIFGPFRVSTAAPTGATPRLQPQKAADPTTGPRIPAAIDKLDSSNHVNRMDASATVGGDIRIDRVADLRRQIASGNYDTPEKMDAALSRFLDGFA